MNIRPSPYNGKERATEEVDEDAPEEEEEEEAEDDEEEEDEKEDMFPIEPATSTTFSTILE